MSTNSFRPRKFEDHEIVDVEKKVVGHIRVKPSGILWSPKNGKDWYGVPIAEFARFMEDKGKKKGSGEAEEGRRRHPEEPKVPAKPGLSRFAWNLAYPEAKRFDARVVLFRDWAAAEAKRAGGRAPRASKAR